MDDFIDFMMLKLIMPALMVLIVLAIFVGLPLLCYALYADSKSPTFTLKKGEWACTQQRIVNSVQSVVSSDGKTVTMIPTTHSVCAQYTAL